MTIKQGVSSKFSFRRLFSFMIKESYQMRRDFSVLALAFFLPLLLIFIYGYAINLDADHYTIGVLVEEENNNSTTLVQAFTNSPYFSVTISRDRQELERLIEQRKIGAYVVIPADLENNILEGNKVAPLQLITDGSETNNANLLANFTKGAWASWLRQKNIQNGLNVQLPITTTNRVWYNPSSISHNSIIPGSIAVIMAIIGTLLTALVIAREWDMGSMESLISTPITILEFILGKLIPYYIIALGSMLICVLFSTYIFKVPFNGSYWLLFIVCTCFLSAALSMGLFISTITKNQAFAIQLSIQLAFLPSYLLSGFIFEVQSLPFVIQIFSHIFPARYFVTCLHSLFLVGNVYKLIILNCLGMLTIASAFIYFNFRLIKKGLD